jgi:hypothetical protein
MAQADSCRNKDSILIWIIRYSPPPGTPLDLCLFSNTVLRGIPYPNLAQYNKPSLQMKSNVAIVAQGHKVWNYFLWPFNRTVVFVPGHLYRKAKRENKRNLRDRPNSIYKHYE